LRLRKEHEMGKLKIDIDLEGTLKVDADGFSGVSCKDATKALDAVFAGATTDTTEKPEMAMLEETVDTGMGAYL
jgi:hypothetical protein